MQVRQKELKAKVDRDGEQVGVLVREPNFRDVQEGQKVYNKAFREALESGALLRERLPHYLREQKLWDDEKEKEYQELLKVLKEGEQKLKKGRIKLSEGKKTALEMMQSRNALRRLLSEQMSLDNATVQAQAENTRFNYYVSVCTVYEDTGSPVFKNMEDYLKRSTKEDFCFEAATLLAGVINNYDQEHEKKLPENAFLLKYKFVNNELRFVNADGHLVDVAGRLVDKNGKYIKYVDDKVVYVNMDGEPVDSDGDLVVDDAGEFIDDVYAPKEEQDANS